VESACGFTGKLDEELWERLELDRTFIWIFEATVGRGFAGKFVFGRCFIGAFGTVPVLSGKFVGNGGR
jgi:hypothetical protein